MKVKDCRDKESIKILLIRDLLYRPWARSQIVIRITDEMYLYKIIIYEVITVSFLLKESNIN